MFSTKIILNKSNHLRGASPNKGKAMYFLIDSQDQAITAHKSMGAAARTLLNTVGASLERGVDPVKRANELAGDRLIMLNLSGAFDAISQSDDTAAQELAAGFKMAIDEMYK